MKQRLIIWCMGLLVPASLRADRFIVNTGPGPEGLPGFSLGGLQWVAVEFDVTTSATITRIDGWILAFREGSLDLSLYSDGGEVPGELLFRGTGFVNSGNIAEWHGISSLNWTVTPGHTGLVSTREGRDIRRARCRFPANVLRTEPSSISSPTSLQRSRRCCTNRCADFRGN